MSGLNHRYPTYLLSLFILLSSGIALADSGIVLYGGYAQHRQEEMNDTNTYPTGTVYGAGFLMRKQFYELEFYAKQGSLSSDITHDNSKNTIEHDQLQVGAALNFFFTKKFYARLGYSFAKIDQKFSKPMSIASEAGAKKEYGLLEEKLVDGLNIGAGYNIYSGTSVDFLIQYDFYYYNSIKANQSSVSVGIKYYLN
ncbi:MAG: hypothetical protein ACOVP4_09850 [Bacteriovoracaceae bacterium]|jgi:hypothetical protein